MTTRQRPGNRPLGATEVNVTSGTQLSNVSGVAVATGARLTVLEASQAWLDVGACMLPVKRDGTKAPDVMSWAAYQKRLLTDDEFEHYFGSGERNGLGIVCGAVSGHLEMFELEGRAVEEGLFDVLFERAEASELGPLVDHIYTGYMERTPSGGIHTFLRVTDGDASKSTKLARRPATPEELQEKHLDKTKVLIETRGEGGFVVVAPSHGPTHSTGRPWKLMNGSPATIAEVTCAERDALYDLARTFDQMPEPKKRTPKTTTTTSATNGDRPGDLFNDAVSCEDVLTECGWTFHHEDNRSTHWTRPGKTDEGSSATVYKDNGRCCVYSTSVDGVEKPGHNNLRPFSLLTQIAYNDNEKAAAHALAARGFTTQAPKVAYCAWIREQAPLPDPGVFFTGAKGTVFAPDRVHAAIMKRATIRLGFDGLLYRYTSDGVYRPDGEQYVKAQTRALLQYRFRKNHAVEVKAYFDHVMPTIGDVEPNGIVNAANGLLDITTGDLRPHSPDVLSTTQLPVRWNPDARCDRFDQFLGEVLPADVVPLVYELFGYCLLTDYRHHYAVMCLGTGANGKSVLLSVLRALLGAANVSSVSLQEIGGEDRFAKAQLHHKLANICGDLGAHDIKRSDDFKKLTGGTDAVSAQHKYAQRFDYVNHAKLWFSANEPPLTTDQTDAWFRRWIILDFARTFAAEEQDARLPGKLTTESEIEGVLVRSIEGLRRLLERGHFELPPSVEASAVVYRERLDSVLAFFDEAVEFKTTESVLRADLYRAYKEWCAETGNARMSNRAFLARVRRDYAGRITEQRIKAGWVVVGVKPTEPARSSW